MKSLSVRACDHEITSNVRLAFPIVSGFIARHCALSDRGRTTHRSYPRYRNASVSFKITDTRCIEMHFSGEGLVLFQYRDLGDAIVVCQISRFVDTRITDYYHP